MEIFLDEATRTLSCHRLQWTQTCNIRVGQSLLLTLKHCLLSVADVVPSAVASMMHCSRQ